MENIKLIGISPLNIGKNGKINRFELFEPSFIGGGAGASRNDVPKIYLQRSPLYEYGAGHVEYTLSMNEHVFEADISDRARVIEQCNKIADLVLSVNTSIMQIADFLSQMKTIAGNTVLLDNVVLGDVQTMEGYFNSIISLIANTEFDGNFVLNENTGNDSRIKLWHKDKLIADVRVCSTFAFSNFLGNKFANLFSDIYYQLSVGATTPDVPTWNNLLQSIEDLSFDMNIFRTWIFGTMGATDLLRYFFERVSNENTHAYIDSNREVSNMICGLEKNTLEYYFNQEPHVNSKLQSLRNYIQLYLLTKIAINIPIDIYYENPTFINLPEPEPPL